MKLEERSKLDLIADEATSFKLKVETISTTVYFDDDEVELIPSDTVSWELESPNKLKAHISFPTSSAHRHFYGASPENANSVSPDYQNFKINSLSTPFLEDTLRIYINGIRLSEGNEIYVPNYNNTESNLIGYTSDYTAGTFELTQAINELDLIVIDYDQDFS
jgi:hypothetical protein